MRLKLEWVGTALFAAALSTTASEVKPTSIESISFLRNQGQPGIA
jgi:hypothetical protein